MESWSGRTKKGPGCRGTERQTQTQEMPRLCWVLNPATSIAARDHPGYIRRSNNTHVVSQVSTQYRACFFVSTGQHRCSLFLMKAER